MTDLEILQASCEHSLLGIDDGKLQKLLEVSHTVDHLDGCVIEVGVYTGGSAKLLALANPNRTIHLFDTFTGIPYNSGPMDFHNKGDFAADENEVRKYLSDCKNVKFYVGTFPKTWPKDNKIKDIVLAHCDVDMEKSAKDFIKVVYNNIVKGGVMIFDDYNAKACPGVKKVVDEFLLESKETKFIVHSTQGILWKK